MSDRRSVNVGETIRNATLVKRADGAPITSGTVNYYLLAQSGANSGKWWKNSDQTWAASETANAMTHQADGHWSITLAASPFADGIKYLEYYKESGDLHVPNSASLIGYAGSTLTSAYDAAKTAAQAGDAMTLTRPPNHWYVAKSGNDSTGDGSQWKPYLTYAKARTSSATNDIIHVGPGTFAEDLDATGRTVIGSGATATVFETTTEAGTLSFTGSGEVRGIGIKNQNTDSPVSVTAPAWRVVIEDCDVEGNIDFMQIMAKAAEAEGSTNVFIRRTTMLTVMGGDGIIQWEPDATLRIEDCSFAAGRFSLDPEYPGNLANGVCLSVQAGNVIAVNSRFAHLAPSVGGGVLVSAGSASLFGCSVQTAAAGMDLGCVAGATLRVSGTSYDTAKTSGTITHVEPGKSILEDTGTTLPAAIANVPLSVANTNAVKRIESGVSRNFAVNTVTGVYTFYAADGTTPLYTVTPSATGRNTT